MMIDELRRFVAQGIPVSRDEAQQSIWEALYYYVLTPSPDHALVIKAPPGVGKTHLSIALMGIPQLARKRILFAGPRSDFFQSDVIPLTIKNGYAPDRWMEWQPRRLEDEERGLCETCVHAPYIQTWLSRGHDGFKFCNQTCGAAFFANECVYGMQAKTKKLWVYGAYEHVFMGHPLQFHIVIGDELPLRAAQREWLIPGHSVIPGGFDPFDQTPVHELLAALQNLVVSYPDTLEGKDLLEALGGADLVKDVADNFPVSLLKKVAPRIHRPEEGSGAPYDYVAQMMHILGREATEALQGKDYLSRVIVHGGKLRLLLRRSPGVKTPGHVIWLDATANERIYKEMFGRDVKIIEPVIARAGEIYQVADIPSAKTSMVTMEGELTINVERTKKLIAHIIKERGYKNVGIITFMAIEKEFQAEGYQTMHFGEETGSNRFESLDALFVVGTPMPSQPALEKIAKMVFFQRMKPFQKKRETDEKLWSKEEKHYQGHFSKQGLSVGGYGGDPDLQAVLWQHREAKIIQAVHRARINIFKVDVWLLSRIPISELPPNHVLTITEIWGGPKKGIEASRWVAFKEFADKQFESESPISTTDICEKLGVKPTAARRWIALLVEQEPDRWGYPPADYIVPKQGRGKPALRLVPKLTTEPGE